jgi:PhnB protein
VNLTPYLYFNGDCEEALRTYERVLGGKIDALLTYEGMPAEQNVPAEWRKKIMHASMTVGVSTLMASDNPPSLTEARSGYRVSINVDSVADAERIYKELTAGGEVTVPLEQTFFAERFAMFSDRFGTRWMVNCA